MLVSPIILENSSIFTLGNGFVRMSAGIRSIRVNVGDIIPCSTLLHNQNSLRLSCFIRPLCSGFLATWIVDWLSICRLDDVLFLKPISDNKFCIQQISFPASTAAEYSASVDDSAMIPCNLEDQLTAPVPIFRMYPPVDRPLSLHPPWSASE